MLLRVTCIRDAFVGVLTFVVAVIVVVPLLWLERRVVCLVHRGDILYRQTTGRLTDAHLRLNAKSTIVKVAFEGDLHILHGVVGLWYWLELPAGKVEVL